jgi:phospholipid-binding lipoprotein MlaA
MNYLRRRIGAAAVAVVLAGCATSSQPGDPLEGFNRAMFSFNDAIDQAALKPVATIYQNAVPSVAQIAVGNFFGNIGDVWTAVNNLLQGKMADGLSDVMRVVVNSTFGIGGLIDIGSDAGMTKHKEDFGQTLGVWGVNAGPYVVLPFLGPSTMRDSLALPVDVQGDLWSYKTPVHVRNAGSVLRVIDQRSIILDATNLIEDAALDRYEFVRDGFLQRRESNVYDGEPPNLQRNDETS